MKLLWLLLLLLLAPVRTSCSKLVLPVDCSDIDHKGQKTPSGVYTIYPHGQRSGVEVYCDMASKGGMWTVFQRRMDGSVNFFRPWDQYELGFGSAAGEYWLGLETIYQLTRRRRYELQVDLEDFEGTKVFARYSSFSVGSGCTGYKLHVSGFIDGGAGDSMAVHNGHVFSTFDRGQVSHCARSFLGAFWYASCHATNPNGVYRWGAFSKYHATGMSWSTWKGHNYSLKTFSMKIHPLL